MRPDEPVYIVDHLTGAICRPDGPPEVVLEPQPTACMVHLEGDRPIEDYEKNYRIVPVRAWLVAQLPDRVQVDPIIDRPDGRGWIIADFQRVPNRVATESPWDAEIFGDDDDMPLPPASDDPFNPAMTRWRFECERRETRAILRHLVESCGYRPPSRHE
jgi:hypothetical protein